MYHYTNHICIQLDHCVPIYVRYYFYRGISPDTRNHHHHRHRIDSAMAWLWRRSTIYRVIPSHYRYSMSITARVCVREAGYMVIAAVAADVFAANRKTIRPYVQYSGNAVGPHASRSCCIKRGVCICVLHLTQQFDCVADVVHVHVQNSARSILCAAIVCPLFQGNGTIILHLTATTTNCTSTSISLSLAASRVL